MFSDLENLEKSRNLKYTSESQKICLKRQGLCHQIPKVGYFLANWRIVILKIFWEACHQTPLNVAGLTLESIVSLKNLGQSHGIPSLLENGDPENGGIFNVE